MTIIERLKLYFVKQEVSKMFDSIKLGAQKYAPIIIGVMGVLIVLTGFLYGPFTVDGVTIPQADFKTLWATLWPAALWIVHHVAKPSVPAAPTSLPASGK